MFFTTFTIKLYSVKPSLELTTGDNALKEQDMSRRLLMGIIPGIQACVPWVSAERQYVERTGMYLVICEHTMELNKMGSPVIL